MLAGCLTEPTVTINGVSAIRSSHQDDENNRCDFRDGLKPDLNEHQRQEHETINPRCRESLPKSCVVHGVCSRLTTQYSDGGHEARRLQPQQDAAVRGKWLGPLLVLTEVNVAACLINVSFAGGCSLTNDLLSHPLQNLALATSRPRMLSAPSRCLSDVKDQHNIAAAELQ